MEEDVLIKDRTHFFLNILILIWYGALMKKNRYRRTVTTGMLRQNVQYDIQRRKQTI